MNARILRSKGFIKHVSHDTHVTFSLGDLIWPDLDLDPYLVQCLYLYICCLLHPVESLLAKFGFAAVISPVSVADKTKNADLDL